MTGTLRNRDFKMADLLYQLYCISISFLNLIVCILCFLIVDILENVENSHVLLAADNIDHNILTLLVRTHSMVWG